MWSMIAHAICLVLLPSSISSLAVAGKRCGTKVCDLLEYCSKFNNQCESCAAVCEKLSHNFDSNLCNEDCQDYLHETRYIKSSNYAADIRQLQKQQTIILIVLIVLLILFAIIHGFHLIRWMRKKDYFSFEFLKRLSGKRTKKQQPAPQTDFTHANPHTQSPPQMRKNNGNGARSVFSISGNESTVQTVSTPISRHPAEDTLDYTYDNEAMTPSSDKPKTETTF